MSERCEDVSANPKGLSRAVIATLRVFLALVMLALVGALPILWVISAEVAFSAPEFAWLRLPYMGMATVVIVCLQVVCIAVLRLLSRVKDSAIFDIRAFFWVRVMIVAGAVGTGVIILALVPVVAVTHGPPGLTVLLFGGICMTASFTLLMIVMRQLLVQATSYRTELAEVI